MIDYLERTLCTHFDQQDILSPSRLLHLSPITLARRCFPIPAFYFFFRFVLLEFFPRLPTILAEQQTRLRSACPRYAT
jgi:hypothetical protein